MPRRRHAAGLRRLLSPGGLPGYRGVDVALLAERGRDGLGGTSSPFMTARHSFSLGSTGRSSLFWSG